MKGKKNRMVTTVTGKRARAVDCRFIKNQYYLVGNPTIENSGDCYKIDGMYRRVNSGYIAYDHQKKSYVLVHKTTLRKGVIGIDHNGSLTEGLFSPDASQNAIINVGSKETGFNSLLCLNDDVANLCGYSERYYDGQYYPAKSFEPSWFTKVTNPPVSKDSLEYDSRYVSNLAKEVYDEKYSPTMDNKYLNAFGDWLERNGITFGIEFETTKGYIPDRFCYRYGLIALRDGSISGLEYVTIPLSGRKGLYALREVCDLMQKRTRHDHNCALHIHLGGLPRTEEDILSAFLLGARIQDEQFLLQPRFKDGTYDRDRKSYCGPFNSGTISNIRSGKKISTKFNRLFSFISDGREYERYNSDLRDVDTHPSDPSGHRKWYIHSRYFWLNLVPIVFGNKKTVEFRHNSSTFKFEKVINMLVSSAAFVYAVKNFKDQIIDAESSFSKLLVRRPNMSQEIINRHIVKNGGNGLHMLDVFKKNNEYISMRKNIMAEIRSGDPYGKTEYKHDGKYDEIFGKMYR